MSRTRLIQNRSCFFFYFCTCFLPFLILYLFMFQLPFELLFPVSVSCFCFLQEISVYLTDCSRCHFRRSSTVTFR